MSSFAKLTSSPGLAGSNYSFYALPVAFAAALLPHLYAQALFDKERAPGTAAYNKLFPSANSSNVKDAKMSPLMQGKFLRAEAATVNGLTNISFFAAAIIAGNMARLTPATLNGFAAIFLGARISYTLIYINNTNELLATLRSATWLTSWISCLVIFVQTGNKFRNGLGNVAF